MAGAGAGVVRGAWFPRAAQRPGAGAWVHEVERALKKNGGCYEAKYAQLATIEKGEAGDGACRGGGRRPRVARVARAGARTPAAASERAH